jgi:hypothetical protein
MSPTEIVKRAGRAVKGLALLAGAGVELAATLAIGSFEMLKARLYARREQARLRH